MTSRNQDEKSTSFLAPPSRRTLLKGIGLGTLGMGFGTLGVESVMARATQSATHVQPSTASVTGFYRFTVGHLQVTAIQEGVATFGATTYGVNAPADEVYAVVPTPTVTASITLLLIEHGSEKILLDAGLGGFVFGENLPNSAKLIPTLNVLGISPDRISKVILSHFHIDHVGGVSSANSPLFPNAVYYLPQAEKEVLDHAAFGGPFDDLIALAQAQLQPVIDNDQLELYQGGDELACGIQAIAAPGHTPGHTAVLLASGGTQLLCLADTATHPLISLQHPEWHSAYDAAPDVAVETRHALLTRAADEKMLVCGYHYPFPGGGYIDYSGDGFKYIPML